MYKSQMYLLTAGNREHRNSPRSIGFYPTENAAGHKLQLAWIKIDEELFNSFNLVNDPSISITQDRHISMKPANH